MSDWLKPLAIAAAVAGLAPGWSRYFGTATCFEASARELLGQR